MDIQAIVAQMMLEGWLIGEQVKRGLLPEAFAS